jgi:hypothetical protein
MAAFCAVLAALFSGLHARRSGGFGARRSARRYHRALDVLGEMRDPEHEHGENSPAIAPQPGLPDPPPEPPPPARTAPPGPVAEAERDDPARPAFVFTDSALAPPLPPPAPKRRLLGRRSTPAVDDAAVLVRPPVRERTEPPAGRAPIEGARPDRRPSVRPPAGRVPRRQRAPRWMVFAVPVLVAIVAVIVVASVSSNHGAIPPPPPSHPTTTSTSTTTTSTSTTTTLPIKSTVPVLSALSPSSGTAGGELTISGSGFQSSDGRIIVRFNGAGTLTSCPSVNECVARIPAGTGTAQVDVVTAAGKSNVLTFTYG